MGGFGNVLIKSLAEKTAAIRCDGDYEEDGLLWCGKCHTKKQCRIDVDGEVFIVGCSCECKNQAYERGIEEQKQNEQRMMIERLRTEGIQDKSLSANRFENASPTDQLEKCKRYVEKWEQVKANNNGLLFFGGTGTGKTFAASCIANALIDQGIPCLVTSFPRILNSGFDKTELIEKMKHYQLLVIDDLGAERQSDYALETVYLAIDERYKSGLPIIVTTNLTWAELSKPSNMSYQRIYDRILEMCVPVKFDGASIRRSKANEKMKVAREIFS